MDKLKQASGTALAIGAITTLTIELLRKRITFLDALDAAVTIARQARGINAVRATPDAPAAPEPDLAGDTYARARRGGVHFE